MAIFENFGKKVGKVANDAAAKSRELAEIARTSVAISDERATIRMLHREIGDKYYRELRQADLEPLRPLCDKIDISQDKIRELETRLRRIKGVRVCDSCGEDSDRKAKFCPACGKPLPETEEAVRAQPEEPVKPD